MLVDTIGSIDDLIENNAAIFNKSMSFLLSKYKTIKSEWVNANECVQDIISTDYGKEEPFTDSEPCLIFRGKDINEIKNGIVAQPPVRYVAKKKFKNRVCLNNDILIEISGGTPTQSTGRCCFITEPILSVYKCSASTAGFSKIIRGKNPIDTFSLFLSLTEAYEL